MSAFFRPRRLFACAVLLACAVLALLISPSAALAAGSHAKAPRAPAVPPPLRIGEINTYKALPEFSTPYRRGWMLALEQVNADGGVLGRKLEVRSRDDRGSADDAVQVAQALVEKDGAVALFGGYSSEVALALSHYADGAKVPYLAVAPLSQRLTWQDGNPYTFRLRPGAWMQAAAVAPKALGLRKLRWALIYQDTESDRAAADAFKGLIKTFQSKTEFVAEEAVAPGKFKAADTVAALAAAKPDAIFNMLTGQELAGLIRAGTAAHLFDGVGVVSLFMGDPENLAVLDATALDAATPNAAPNGTPNAAPSGTPNSMPNAASDAGSLAAAIPDGWIITGYPRDAIDTPENQAFVQAYRDRYGDAPDMAAVLGYTALRSIAEGLKRAGTPDRDALAAAFPRLQVPTPFGTIEYRNLDHQATLGIYLGYTGHADGRLAMERFVYATGGRLQPLDDQIRRLRARAARADSAVSGRAANAASAASAANAAHAASAARPAGPASPASPANTTVDGASATTSKAATPPAHPITGSTHPVTRPDMELNSRLSAARPGSKPPAPAAGAQPQDARSVTSMPPVQTPRAASGSATETGAGAHASPTGNPIQSSRPGLGTQAPAMANWPDQVGQPALPH